MVELHLAECYVPYIELRGEDVGCGGCVVGGGGRTGCLRIRESFGFEENSIRFEDPPNNDSALLKSLVFERPPRGITVLVSSSMDGRIYNLILTMGPRRHLSPRKDFACCKKKQGKDTKHIFSCPRCRRDCSSDIVDHPLFEWLGVATCIDCKTRCPGKQEEDTATFGICRTCPGGKQFYGANIGVAAYWKHVNDFRKYHPVGSCIKKSRPT